jgi:type I restriction enzyme M protein
MDAAEYKHVVLGLIFLKYISADFVLANGRMSLNQSGEGETRRALIKAARVDCMVVLPGQFFNSLQFPVYLWFRGKSNTFNSANGARLFDGKTELSLVA